MDNSEEDEKDNAKDNEKDAHSHSSNKNQNLDNRKEIIPIYLQSEELAKEALKDLKQEIQRISSKSPTTAASKPKPKSAVKQSLKNSLNIEETNGENSQDESLDSMAVQPNTNLSTSSEDNLQGDQKASSQFPATITKN